MSTATTSASTAPSAAARTPQAPGVTGPAVARELLRIQRDPLGAMDHFANTYGDVMRLSANRNHNTFFVRGPEAVRHVLLANQDGYRKSNQYELLQRALGMGLLNSEGEPWQRRRALIQPMFAKRHLAPFADHMASAAASALDRWERDWPAGQTVDLTTEMSAITLDVVGRALVGTDFSARSAEFGAALFEYLTAAGKMGRSPITQVGGAFRNVGVTRSMQSQVLRWRQMSRACDTLEDVVFEIIDRRIAAEPNAAGDDLLTLLLQARDPESGAPLDRTALRDELMTFVLAGHETTANGLTWMWSLLSQNPAARDQLLAEVDEVLGGRVPTAADVDALPWTTACFQEAMRLFPPAWHVQRTSRADDVVGGYLVPRGSLVVVSTWTTHRDPAVWENPAGYDPRRFLGDAPKQRPRHAFVPFGGGRRVCIGQGFAMLEGVILAAMMAQRVTFDLVPGTPIVPEPTATLRPLHGLPVTANWRRTG